MTPAQVAQIMALVNEFFRRPGRESYAAVEAALLAPQQAEGLCDRICGAIKAADDKSTDEAGYMLDPSDPTTMFQDAAGTTPVTAVEPDERVECELLAAFDDAVATELPCVSTVQYNSHEICKWFAKNVRDRLAARTKGTK